jgi:hypothetical protein
MGMPTALKRRSRGRFPIPEAVSQKISSMKDARLDSTTGGVWHESQEHREGQSLHKIHIR